MPRRLIIGWMFLTFSLIASHSATAQITISTFILEFSGNGALRQDFQVRNPTSETQYVTLQPFQITRPGFSDSKRVPFDDPRKFGMLISPSRMVIPPGTFKTARVILTAPPGKDERIYRITVKPVFGQVQSGQYAIKVAVGYDMLMIVRSNSGKGKLTSSRQGRKLTIKNEGNASLYINGGKQCNSDKSDCAEVTGFRLYAGNEKNITLPRDGPVELVVIEGRQSRIVEF